MHDIISFVKFLATSNAINFVLMVMILAWIVNKVNLGKSFDSSIKAVETGIKNSDDAKADSVTKLNEAKVLMDRLPSDIQELEKNTEEKKNIFRTQIEEDAVETIAKLGVNADRVLEAEEKKLSNLLTQQASVEVIDLAKSRIIEKLKQSPQLHNQFILNSIDELDKVNL
jgi:F0F1-type ATP synthase membrane subunit b/b'